ncbi:hypothetical protein ASE00_16640 [Sphingomonas sp. Root710]|nr:hypothetical protein ASE00_16640 [Sphingomonas sp. Root710]
MPQHARRIRKLSHNLLLCTALMAAPSFGQQLDTAASESAGETSDRLQEIVVTAQRRAENVQNVPVAISAFGGDSLKATGVTSILQLKQVDPSLNTSFNQGVAFPSLRGIGNIAAGLVGNEASVAMYVDDVYYTRLYSSLLNLGDIDRVEVLKGPQGTLFGRNATGGAIQVFTRDPGPATEVHMTLGYANYDTISGQAYISTPISDTLSWNISAGGTDQRDGWGHSVVNGQKEYLGKNWTVRSKLVWEPGDRTRVKIVGFYAFSKEDFGLPHDVVRGSYVGTPSGNPPPAGYPDPRVIVPSLGDLGNFYGSRFLYRNFVRQKTYGGSLRIDQELDFADLVSISGFKKSKVLSFNQMSQTSPNFFLLPQYIDNDDISQEIQIKSHKDSRISWIVGAYYLRYRAGYNPAQIYGDILGPGAIINLTGLQTVNSYSAFGQATAPLGGATNLTLGVRGSMDRLRGFGQQFITIPGVGTFSSAGAGVPNPYRGNKTFRSLTWKAALDHHFSGDVMGYLSISRGFKAGTYNTFPLATSPAKPEVVDAYEAGFKSELWDRRVRVNGALFWNEIKDPQVITVLPSSSAVSVGLVNAQKARSRGFEVGVNAVVVRGAELRADATYLDAKYTKFTNGPFFTGGLTAGTTIAGPFLGDASGYALPNSSRWRFDVGASYTFESSIGKWTGDINASYTGRVSWSADNAYFQRAITLVNASLNFTPASFDNVTFGLWGKNLGNVKYYAYAEQNALGGDVGGYRAEAAAPRTWGGTISVKY